MTNTITTDTREGNKQATQRLLILSGIVDAALGFLKVGVGIFANPGEELPKTDNPIDLLTYDWIHPRNQLVGTAEFVTEKIHELKSELNLQHLAIWSSPPGMPHDASMKSLKLFNEKVAPHFSDDKLIKKVS